MSARRRGFTLIELLVVITIIVTLTVGVMPAFRASSDSYRMKETVRRLCDFMHFCNSMAVFESAAYRVNLDRATSRCWVTFEREPLERPGVFEPYRASGYSGYAFQPGVFVKDVLVNEEPGVEPRQEGETGGDYIEFRGDGTADEAVLVLTDGRDETLSIRISGMTAAVQILDEEFVEEDFEDEGRERPVREDMPERRFG